MSRILNQLRAALYAAKDLNERLSFDGYCVLDNAIDEASLKEIRDEVIFLDDCCVLEPSPSKLQGINGEQIILEKPGVREFSLILRSEKVAGDCFDMVPHLRCEPHGAV